MRNKKPEAVYVAHLDDLEMIYKIIATIADTKCCGAWEWPMVTEQSIRNDH